MTVTKTVNVTQLLLERHQVAAMACTVTTEAAATAMLIAAATREIKVRLLMRMEIKTHGIGSGCV